MAQGCGLAFLRGSPVRGFRRRRVRLLQFLLPDIQHGHLGVVDRARIVCQIGNKLARRVRVNAQTLLRSRKRLLPRPAFHIAPRLNATLLHLNVHRRAFDSRLLADESLIVRMRRPHRLVRRGACFQ